MGWNNQNDFVLLIVQAGTGFSGLFVYSPVPGAGNLIASVAGSGGTDPFGNAYVQGFGTYGAANTIEMNGGIIDLLGLGSVNPAQIQAAANFLRLASGNSGAGTLVSATFASSGFAAGGNAQVVVASGGSATGTTPALLEVQGATALSNIAAPAAAAGAGQLFGIAGQLAQVNASGQTGRLSSSGLADVSTVTVTGAAAFTNLFSGTIKGNDAVVGAVYKATAFGFGAWGNPVQDIVFGTRFGATDASTIGTAPDLNSADFAAGALIRWKAEAELTCVTTGATAHWVCNISGCVTQTANSIIPGTAGTNTVPFAGGTGSGTVTLDSTVDELFGISAQVPGTGTLTKVGGWLERVA